jgi:cytochrome P450
MICDSVDMESSCRPSKGRTLFRNVTRLLPGGVLTWLFERSRKEGAVKLRQNRAETHSVARKMIKEKREELRAGTPQPDILSLLGLLPRTYNCEGCTHTVA